MEQEIREKIERGRYLVPDHMWGGIERYLVNRIPVGNFLTALLSNDLMETCARADEVNMENLHNWATFLYNYAPFGSYGSPEAVREWLNPTKGSE